MTLLVVDRLRTTEAGREVTFEVAAGEVVVLAGPAGTGKSTLLRSIGGQRRPVSGRVRLGDDDVTRASPRALCRLGVGQALERPGGFESLSVRESAQVALLSARGEIASWWRPVRPRHRARAELLLRRVGLLDAAHRPVADLPTEGRRRLDIALALAGRPRLLLLDEPVAGFDAPERDALLATLHRLAREEEVGLLIAATDGHNLDGVADRVLQFEAGAIVAQREQAGSRARRGFA